MGIRDFIFSQFDAKSVNCGIKQLRKIRNLQYLYSGKQLFNIFDYFSIPFFPACKVRPPVLPSNSISCHINASCTGISCCFDDDITGLTYQISVTMDSCGETLIITLEKMKFEISLFDYPMGTKSTAQLFGILQLE